METFTINKKKAIITGGVIVAFIIGILFGLGIGSHRGRNYEGRGMMRYSNNQFGGNPTDRQGMMYRMHAGQWNTTATGTLPVSTTTENN
ncbi:MAG: hypothetical protein WC444_01010 [Candidatus Paceibacterota bacterium]